MLVNKCPVCGLLNEGSVCTRCSTILVWESAKCPKCGRNYSSSIAICDFCERKDRGEEVNVLDEDLELRNLTVIGGLTRETAKTLYSQGLRDFSDLVRMALPQKAVNMGLHKTIARRMMMSEFVRKMGHRDESKCPICLSDYDPLTGTCQKCKYSPLPEWSEEVIKKRLTEVTGEVENLAHDPDFKDMPESVKKQILAEIDGVLEPLPDEDKLIDELDKIYSTLNEDDERRREYQVQIEAWRKKGFDVSELETLLANDLDNFASKCVNTIRKQVKDRQEDTVFVCPMCEAQVDPGAKECQNCGALFDWEQT